MNVLEKKNIAKKFNANQWHDSRILSIALRMKEFRYLIELEVLFTKSELGAYEDHSRALIFDPCRLFVADIDVLGMQLCGGMIASAHCYLNPLEFEKKMRNKENMFDLEDRKLPLSTTSVFEFELISPSGSLTIFAPSFVLIDNALNRTVRKK